MAAPVQSQPPGGRQACPPGLECLGNVDQILICQKVELLEAFTGFESANKYQISNGQGQPMFYAAEETDCCTRFVCGRLRKFQMSIMDNSGRKVMHLIRPWRPCSENWLCCCQNFLQMIEVQAPPGNPIGYVHQKYTCFLPEYDVTNVTGQTLLKCKGACCGCNCCSFEFPVLSVDGNTEVGKITKQFSGMAKELFTDADNFGICFPRDLDIKCKATLIAACFLIDFMFFEH